MEIQCRLQGDRVRHPSVSRALLGVLNHTHTLELGAELQRLLGVGVEGAGETLSGPSEALPGPFKPEKVDVSRPETSLMMQV